MKWFTYLLSVLILSGCAAVPLTHDQCNATKYATAHEHEQCLQAATKYMDEQHAQEDKRILRREQIVSFVQRCMQNQGTTLITYRLTRWEQRAMDKHGDQIDIHTLPRGLTRANFGCMSDDDLQRAINAIGSGW